jgi:hypothetical protein
VPKPIAKSQLLQDTFEKLQQQGSDVAQGVKGLAKADSAKPVVEGEEGVERLGGKSSDTPQGASSQSSFIGHG